METALHLCAAIRDIDSVRYLILEAHAYIKVNNLRNETPIFYATRSGHHEIANFLLQQGANVTHVSTVGYSIMHCLVFLDDEQAAQLAPKYVHHGARLDSDLEENHKPGKDNFKSGDGTPLFWAAQKNLPKLFPALLQLHAKPEHAFERSLYLKLLGVLSLKNISRMFSMAIESIQAVIPSISQDLNTTATWNASTETLTQPDSSPQNNNVGNLGLLTSSELSGLLYNVMDFPPPILLLRRQVLTSSFHTAKQNIVTLLLSMGANPIQTQELGEDRLNALTIAITTDDVITVEAFINHLELQACDVMPF